MKKELILETEFFTLWFDPELKAIRHELKKPVPAEAMKELLTKGAEALAARRVSRWLSDDRKNGEIPIEIEEWARSEWAHKTAEAGWRYWAVVIPASAFAALSVGKQARIHKSYGVSVYPCLTVEEARAWLANQPE